MGKKMSRARAPRALDESMDKVFGPFGEAD
jgi:hypothetical protein